MERKNAQGPSFSEASAPHLHLCHRERGLGAGVEVGKESEPIQQV